MDSVTSIKGWWPVVTSVLGQVALLRSDCGYNFFYQPVWGGTIPGLITVLLLWTTALVDITLVQFKPHRGVEELLLVHPTSLRNTFVPPPADSPASWKGWVAVAGDLALSLPLSLQCPPCPCSSSCLTPQASVGTRMEPGSLVSRVRSWEAVGLWARGEMSTAGWSRDILGCRAVCLGAQPGMVGTRNRSPPRCQEGNGGGCQVVLHSPT